MLSELAGAAGLDPVAVKNYLASNEDFEEIKQQVHGNFRSPQLIFANPFCTEAQLRNISGVPHFTISKPGARK